jgi:uncharacterized protein YciI
VKCLLFYLPGDDIAATAPAHFPAHRAWYEEFHRRGELLMIGAFADAQADGAMGVFTSRAAAEKFVSGDPFVRHGVVRTWELRDWNEALVPAPADPEDDD